MMEVLVRGAGATVRCPITEPPAPLTHSYWGQSMKLCTIEGCEKKAHGRVLCGMHQMRFLRYGRLNLIRRKNGTGNINAAGYVDVRIDGGRTYEHIAVAEKALGRRLPKGAVVHHVNENRSDNTPTNLVICPNEAYHRLLHRRMKALTHV